MSIGQLPLSIGALFHEARGSALVECIASLLALTPFIVGIPLLGKQFDLKHKSIDAARYVAWERTVWSNEGPGNLKDDQQIALETRDRIFGHPRASLVAAGTLAAAGVSDNPLWRDSRNQPLLAYLDGRVPISIHEEELPAPVPVGELLVPGLAYGTGPSRSIAAAIGAGDLQLESRAFARARAVIGLRTIFAGGIEGRATSSAQPRDEHAPNQFKLKAEAAILSDAWSARDENSLRRRVDDVTTDELVESLELAGRVIALQALGKGQPLYGEGQFATNPDLRPASNALPAAYVQSK